VEEHIYRTKKFRRECALQFLVKPLHFCGGGVFSNPGVQEFLEAKHIGLHDPAAG
jgi:hypothetical protein